MNSSFSLVCLAMHVDINGLSHVGARFISKAKLNLSIPLYKNIHLRKKSWITNINILTKHSSFN